MLGKIYMVARIVAYIATLTGLGLLFWGRSIESPAGEVLQTASAACVALGFASFLVSYAIYMYLRFVK